jgi:2-phospho-L-lactate guanylyltransferase
MPTVAVIPIKSFAMGKQRLSDALTPEARAGLGRGLANHVASTAATAGLLPLVVTADREVAEWSTLAGFPSMADPGVGLNEAAASGVKWATAAGCDWIVLHADLPLLTTSDLSALGQALGDGTSVIAPSADGGTSAIGSDQPVAFSFGVSSFHRHLPKLASPAVVTRRGLLLDIDSVVDLEAATSAPSGSWLQELIKGSGVPDEGHNLY